MIELLQQCSDNFGPPPRKFSLWDRFTYLRMPTPLWLRTSPWDKLLMLQRHLLELYQDGHVVWGHIIQANSLLYEAGSDDCPATVVYSLADPSASEETLQHVAQDLFALKGTEPLDPGLARIAEALTDEMTRVFGLPVPASVSPTLSCQISSTFFMRKHLPERRLCSMLLPFVVNPKEPFFVMPLPVRYWPDELVTWWTRDKRER